MGGLYRRHIQALLAGKPLEEEVVVPRKRKQKQSRGYIEPAPVVEEEEEELPEDVEDAENGRKPTEW